MMNAENNDDNKPQRKIQIFNNKDGTYNRKDFVDDELVNEEFYQGKKEEKPGDTLRSFLSDLNACNPLPKGWRDSPIGQRAYSLGYEEGYSQAAEEYEKTLEALRHILDLESQRAC